MEREKTVDANLPDLAEKAKSLFPVGITLEEARLAIKDASGFRETIKGDVSLLNYDFAFKGSFPDPNESTDPAMAYLLKVRRECRGLIFNIKTGKVISRRFHKFFNIFELPETEPHRIDLSQPHVLLEKADGSLVAPLETEGKIRLGSKMGVTDMSSKMEEDFLASTKIRYLEFCSEWLSKGFTPLFEFCSRAAPIVIEYPADRLVLTAIRNNHSGEYLRFGEMTEAANKFEIPVVAASASNFKTVEELVEKIKAEKGVEGFVLRFDNGIMYKIKSEWYIERHRRNSTFQMQEKDIWKMILEGSLDDSVYMAAEKRDRLNDFAAKLLKAVERTSKSISAIVDDAKQKQMQKREFVEYIKRHPSLPFPAPLYFAVFDGADSYKNLVKVILASLSSSSQLEKVRNLAEGSKWNG